MAIVDAPGNMTVVKKAGKVAVLRAACDAVAGAGATDTAAAAAGAGGAGGKLSGNLGIAHTRWATHGAPNDVNAHPHLSPNGNIALVHNGIIENFTALKALLMEKG